MHFPVAYRILDTVSFDEGHHTLTPIRYQDRWDIMKWRNQQIYHLRQAKPLTAEDQEFYFTEVVSKLFAQERPSQLLFSYLYKGQCIGYGGLVHINWVDKNAEISFIMDTELETDEFHKHWGIYLSLIEKVAFTELNFHKIFTYAFNLRPHLYEAIEAVGYKQEAVLKEHCLFEGEYIDVIIHSKINDALSVRPATIEDLELTYTWATNPKIRAFAFNQQAIPFEAHSNWFKTKIENTANCQYYIALLENKPIGSIRFDYAPEEHEWVISYLLDPKVQGRALGKKLLEIGCQTCLNQNKKNEKQAPIVGYVMPSNLASVKAFERLGFNKNVQNDGCLKYSLV